MGGGGGGGPAGVLVDGGAEEETGGGGFPTRIWGSEPPELWPRYGGGGGGASRPPFRELGGGAGGTVTRKKEKSSGLESEEWKNTFSERGTGPLKGSLWFSGTGAATNGFFKKEV